MFCAYKSHVKFGFMICFSDFDQNLIYYKQSVVRNWCLISFCFVGVSQVMYFLSVKTAYRKLIEKEKGLLKCVIFQLLHLIDPPPFYYFLSKVNYSGN